MEHERIPTDDPIRHIWNRYGVLSTLSGAERFLRQNTAKAGACLDSVLLKRKALGLAFCIRSAEEFFRVGVQRELTSTCVAYYYGTLNLLEALLLSRVDNRVTLDDLEKYTRRGHGIMSVSHCEEEFPESEKVAILNGGFLPAFLSKSGYNVSSIAVAKRYHSSREVQNAGPDEIARVFSVKDLLARIPELRAIYVELFKEQPDYPSFHVRNRGDTANPKLEVEFPAYRNSVYLSCGQIRSVLPADVLKGVEFKWEGKPGSVALTTAERIEDHAEAERVQQLANEEQYKSVMAFDCYVKPLLSIGDVLMFDFLLLYCLSIWVRYRPALWREISDGKYDLYRSLFANFLMAVERIVPNEVLNRIHDKRLMFVPFSYLS